MLTLTQKWLTAFAGTTPVRVPVRSLFATGGRMPNTSRVIGAVALLSLTIAGACATGARSAGSASDSTAQEWIELFNGRNLDGWIAKVA